MIPGLKSLMQPGQVTTLIIKTPEGDDNVRFSRGRLDGPFIRKKDGKVLIDGTYKAGLEDSIWTFKNIGDRKVTKVTFVNGERTGIQNFNGSDLVSYNKVSTRAVVNRNKIIQIVVLSMLMIGAFTMILINYRRRSLEKLQIALAWRWLACLLLPICVWALQLAIIYLLGDYQFDLLFMPVMIVIVYVVTFPLFLIIVFGVKLSRPVDVLWYSLLFAFAFSIWIEWDILTALSV